MVIQKRSAKIEETYLHFALDSVSATNLFAFTRDAVIIAPVCSSLAVGAIPCHVAGTPTNTTDDICSEIALLGTVILPMPDLATY